MIGTIMKIGWLELRRSRIELALVFVLPIVFFSIFAVIMGGTSQKSSTPKLRTVLVDEDQSDVSKRFLEGVRTEPTFVIAKDGDLDRDTAEKRVRAGKADLAIVVPKKFGETFAQFGNQDAPSVEVLSDSSDPIAAQVGAGMLQKAAFNSVDLLAERGFQQFEKLAGAFTPFQKAAVQQFLPKLKELNKKPAAKKADEPKEKEIKSTDSSTGFGLVPVKVVDVVGEKKQNPVMSFYAAAVAVMFLLFSAAGAGGSLLDEQENGTLDRLLGSRLTMTQLIAGKWLMVTVLGCVQLVAMFVWAWLMFKVDLPGHIPGFVAMTIPTAAAAASVGLLLAALCRSRAQLSGISTIVILTMSAFGGSMFPRFAMPESVQNAGLFTFNAWALDGFQKVFWRDAPLVDLLPQVLMLVFFAVIFLAAARLLARRWESA